MKQIYVIGDSISIQYGPYLQQALRGVMEYGRKEGLGYLRLLGAAQARRVEFIADGAEWIWERTEALRQQAEIPAERWVEVIDFDHARERLPEAVAVCRRLSAQQRERLYEQLRHTLRGNPLCRMRHPLFANAPVASHDRARPGERRTHPDHLPPEKLPGLLMDRAQSLQQATQIGTATRAVVEQRLADPAINRLPSVRRLLKLQER